MTKILFDFDDLHYCNPVNCITDIDYLCKEIPNIKMLFFTVPLYNGLPIYNDKNFCNRIIKHINNGNIEIAVHGTTHTTLEYKHISEKDAETNINLSIDIFNKANIPIKKIFKGPNWGLNQNTINILEKLEFTHIFNHEEYSHLQNNNLKFIYYNWNLKDNFDEKLLYSDFIIAHGHTWDVCNNGIKEVSNKIIETLNKYPQLTPTFI